MQRNETLYESSGLFLKYWYYTKMHSMSISALFIQHYFLNCIAFNCYCSAVVNVLVKCMWVPWIRMTGGG
jgi:hypothetical protein